MVWELCHPQPVVNVRLLGHRSFAICCGVMFLIGFLLISTTQLLPQLAQSAAGTTTPPPPGLTLGVGGIVTLLLMPIAGIVTGRLIQPKWLVLMAVLGTGWSLLHASSLNLDIGVLDLSSVAYFAGDLAAVPVHPDQRGVLCRPAAEPAATRRRR